MILFDQISNIERGEVVIGVTLFVVVIYTLKLFMHVVHINDVIERLIQQRDAEIKGVKTSGMTIIVFESIKVTITEKYSDMIDPLVRRKGYILDILPFLPKK